MQAKKRIPPLVTSTPENPEPKTKKIQTRRLTESVGGVNSFLVQIAGEFSVAELSCTGLRIPLNTICEKPGFNSLNTPLNHGASYTIDASKETQKQRNLSNASQDRQAALKEHFAVMQYRTASTTRQPRGEHRGTIKALQDCGRHYVTRTIHSPQSSPLSLELGKTNVNEGTKKINETHILQNDQGVVEF